MTPVWQLPINGTYPSSSPVLTTTCQMLNLAGPGSRIPQPGLSLMPPCQISTQNRRLETVQRFQLRHIHTARLQTFMSAPQQQPRGLQMSQRKVESWARSCSRR